MNCVGINIEQIKVSTMSTDVSALIVYKVSLSIVSTLSTPGMNHILRLKTYTSHTQFKKKTFVAIDIILGEFQTVAILYGSAHIPSVNDTHAVVTLGKSSNKQLSAGLVWRSREVTCHVHIPDIPL